MGPPCLCHSSTIASISARVAPRMSTGSVCTSASLVRNAGLPLGAPSRNLLRSDMQRAIGGVCTGRSRARLIPSKSMTCACCAHSKGKVCRHAPAIRPRGAETARSITRRSGHWCNETPLPSVDAPRISRPKTDDALTLDEAKALLEAARGDRLEAMLIVGMTLGLRKGEGLGLGGKLSPRQGRLKVDVHARSCRWGGAGTG